MSRKKSLLLEALIAGLTEVLRKIRIILSMDDTAR
jgi:hypothetical protein